MDWGAAFYALFTAYQYIAAGTYDTTYESSYWIRVILGLIAGVVLPSLIPVSSSNSSGAVTRPLLALLGGFSAAVLYRILQRLVEMVETLAEGDAKPAEQARTTRSRPARWLGWVRSGSHSSVSLFTCETSSWPASRPGRPGRRSTSS